MNTEEIFQAINVVNFHAKTATQPKQLYLLKKMALQKLIDEGKAQKIGITLSPNPKYSQQQLDMSVKCECGKYYFHIPPTKDDIRTLLRIEKIRHRNPRERLSVGKAKYILIRYISR